MTASLPVVLDGPVEHTAAHARLAARALASRTAVLAALQLTGYGAFLLFQLGAARFLGASGYGALAHALAMGSFVSLVAIFGSDRILVRELLQRTDRHARAALVRASLAQRALLGLPAAAVLGWVVSRTASGAGLAAPVACFYLLQSLDLAPVFDGERASWMHVGGFAARNVALIALLAALAGLQGASPAATAWGMAGASAAFLAFQVAVASRRGWLMPGPVTGSDVARLVRLCWPLALASAAVQTYQQLPLLALGWVEGAASAGRYAIAAQLAFALLGLVGLAYRLILPELARLARASRLDAWRRTWGVSATVGVGAALVAASAWALAPLLAACLAPGYQGSVEAFRVLLVMVPLVAFGSVFGNALLALGEVRRFVAPVLTGVAAGAAACAALVPGLGVRGAAWALVGAQLAVVGASVLAFIGARPREPEPHRSAADPHVPLASGCRIVELHGDDPSHQRHLARYRFASALRGQVLLDAACGSGYGTELLADRRAARRVIGVDLSLPALTVASGRAPAPADRDPARYVAADATALPVATGAVDLVVSFETIEHVLDVGAYLAEIERVLAPDGTLVVSTPNRRFASPYRGGHRAPRNRFHRVEWRPREFFDLLALHFDEVEALGQVPVSRPRLHEARCFVRGLFDVAIARRLHRVAAGRPAHAALRAIYRRLLGADPAVVGAVHGAGGPRTGAARLDRFAVGTIPAGCEPLVMVAVCRRPRTTRAPAEGVA